jgi:hypothetical protein
MTEYQLPEPKMVKQYPTGLVKNFYTADQMQQAYAAGRDELVQAVRKVHAAKGRYHSQIAMCQLYALCDLPNDGPMK